MNDPLAISDVNSSEEDFIIYPNPANDIVNIAFPINTVDNNLTIQVFNTLGQLVDIVTDSSLNSGRGGFESLTWDASHLESGTYFIAVSTVKFQATKSLIIK